MGLRAQRAVRVRRGVLRAHLPRAPGLLVVHQAADARGGGGLRMRRSSIWKWLALQGGLTLACVATIYPVLWVVKMALSPTAELSLSANPLPQHVTLEHFASVLMAKSSTGQWVFGRQ